MILTYFSLGERVFRVPDPQDRQRFTDGYYVNVTDDESQARNRANYRGNVDRLLALKNQYDPTNLFRLNANIEPTA